MPHGSLRVGAVEVVALCDVVGDFPAPLRAAFPDVAAHRWEPFRARYPETFDGPDAWRLHDHCYLVRTADRTLLVDTGVGPPSAAGANWIGTPGRLDRELEAAGVRPDEVDVVVLTHLHLDHIGWNLVADGGPVRARFGRASYLVQRADWEAFQRVDDAEDRAAFEQAVRPLERLGVLELLDGERRLGGGLTLLHTPGHTPGSQSLLVVSQGARALLWGDVANHPAQVTETGWCTRADEDCAQAERTRELLLDRIEAEGMTLVPAHFPEPFGQVVRVDGRRYWQASRPG